jgi:hypothetical protein
MMFVTGSGRSTAAKSFWFSQLERKKKATMHMRLDQFVGEQSEQPSEDYSLDSQQHSWGRQAGRAQQQVVLIAMLPERTAVEGYAVLS